MNSKIQTLTQLAADTASRMTGSFTDWTAFLQTAARLYKDVCYERQKKDSDRMQHGGWLVCGTS